MQFVWFRKGVKKAQRRRRLASTNTHHYQAHKETARTLVHERLQYWNQLYQFTYNRVAIRDQRSRWGSCSSQKNLNFNYRIAFLPLELADYIIVHELCHLAELNHGNVFWQHVARALPEYQMHKQILQSIRLIDIHERTFSAPSENLA
jgi:predicted metal-dependent hydrolase